MDYPHGMISVNIMPCIGDMRPRISNLFHTMVRQESQYPLPFHSFPAALHRVCSYLCGLRMQLHISTSLLGYRPQDIVLFGGFRAPGNQHFLNTRPATTIFSEETRRSFLSFLGVPTGHLQKLGVRPCSLVPDEPLQCTRLESVLNFSAGVAHHLPKKVTHQPNQQVLF